MKLPSVRHIALASALAIVFPAFGGCGPSEGPTDPEIGARQKQSRIDAYGAAGIANAKGAKVSGSSNPSANSAQANARQKAQQGGR